MPSVIEAVAQKCFYSAYLKLNEKQLVIDCVGCFTNCFNSTYHRDVSRQLLLFSSTQPELSKDKINIKNSLIQYSLSPGIL